MISFLQLCPCQREITRPPAADWETIFNESRSQAYFDEHDLPSLQEFLTGRIMVTGRGSLPRQEIAYGG